MDNRQYIKDCISKDKIREHLKKLNISDIEPWSVYKISGIWLFNLERLLEEEYSIEELLEDDEQSKDN